VTAFAPPASVRARIECVATIESRCGESVEMIENHSRAVARPSRPLDASRRRQGLQLAPLRPVASATTGVGHSSHGTTRVIPVRR
jgi:hypothetical protein